MRIKEYSKARDLMFLDLEIADDEPIPDIIRIFTKEDYRTRYTHFLYAKFEATIEGAKLDIR